SYWIPLKQVQPVSVAPHGIAVPGELQLRPVQQACVLEHPWPICEQTGAASGDPLSVVPPSVVPPSGGGGVEDWHFPANAPVAMLQKKPGQQSDVAVQAPWSPLHMLPQWRMPFVSGRHGAPPQHSAEK